MFAASHLRSLCCYPLGVCGRYTVTNPGAILSEVLGSEDCPELEARYNVAPTQLAPVVIAAENGARRLVQMRWGLVPNWTDTPRARRGMINARVETVAEKPTYRESLYQRRCVVAADGFYEWQRLPGGKQPYLLRLVDGAPFGFAGLWDCWRDPRGTLLETFTILTTTANALVKTIHDRMPVILSRQHREEWLSPGIEMRALNRLCQPYSVSAMEAVPVSVYVNNVAHDSPACLKPIRLQAIRGLF